MLSPFNVYITLLAGKQHILPILSSSFLLNFQNDFLDSETGNLGKVKKLTQKHNHLQSEKRVKFTRVFLRKFNNIPGKKLQHWHWYFQLELQLHEKDKKILYTQGSITIEMSSCYSAAAGQFQSIFVDIRLQNFIKSMKRQNIKKTNGWKFIEHVFC